MQCEKCFHLYTETSYYALFFKCLVMCTVIYVMCTNQTAKWTLFKAFFLLLLQYDVDRKD